MHYDLVMKKPSQKEKSVKRTFSTYNYLYNYLILTFENAARDQIYANSSTAGAQEWWVQNPSTFFLKGTECICVCTFVYAQDSVTHTPLINHCFSASLY